MWAGKGFFPGMRALVSSQVTLAGECGFAQGAEEGPLARVTLHVPLQFAGEWKSGAAVRAGVPGIQALFPGP